ncbi:hypothetical protein CesoFtcFv8_025644 [Champsocephalus esox]|uniref:Adhesion G-protein coupled receptor G2 n=1 Tax=Champsocephalus esox TaxID=159716 RepID=A0AAN8GD74_9TELE|nr:hypothetical protein CesoFtcFv8_025644 [Champsocephalus esox]
MHGLCFEGRWGWTHVLFVIWLSLLAAAPTKAFGYFLGDTKAVLNGCKDHWTLQDRAAMPLLFQMTLCVDIRVVVPGAWVAFSYSSVHAPRPELGLEGDEDALYAWLLRVRHRFPIRLSPKHWHSVCLRRDVQHNSFSLEVDGKMVAQRTVIAQAIPPAGSMWLGCRPRDQPPGDTLGDVELYLFRMWGDLGNHGLCEDGSVIGWNTHYWGVTSPRARQRDPNLLCDHRRLRRGARVFRRSLNAPTTGVGRFFSPPPVPYPTSTLSPVSHVSNHTSKVKDSPTIDWTPSPATVLPYTTVPASDTRSANQMSTSTQKTPITTPVDQTPAGRTSGSSLVNCDISQLCSNDSAYFWMTINVTAKNVSKTEQDVHNLVSNAFSCATNRSDTAQRVTDFIDFCQDDKFIQTVQVNCSAKSNIRQTTCDVLLQLSRAVSACELQRAGDSALQQAADTQIEVRITGEVERVGQGICGDMEPSSGRFVRCTSNSSLDDICQANTNPKLTCSFLEPNSYQALQPDKEFGCSEYHSEAPSFCDCTAFCNSSRQFFAIRIHIHSVSVSVNLLKTLLAGLARMCLSMSASECQDILERYQHAHLECHGTEQRLYSCMVILEMSGPVNGCFLKKLLKQIIDRNNYITSEKPLTRMVVCGPPGLAIRTLLGSNLTWVESDLLMSDVCQPDPTLLKCEGKESLAINTLPIQTTTLPETTTSQEAQEELANELLNQAQNASQLNSSQVAQLVGNLEKLLDGSSVSKAVGQKVINVVSNLMEGNSVALSASANRLVQVVEDVGLQLIIPGDREILSSGSVVLAVRSIDGTNFPQTSFNIFNTDNVQLRALSRSRSKRSGSALGSVSLPSSLTAGLSPEDQQLANRVQFTFYTKPALFQDDALNNQTLVSPVLAASVTNLSISNLAENIQFTIRNVNPIDGNYSASCAFWDFTQNGGGGWSSAGCFVVNNTPEETTCSCNHLTSFAILLDLSREGIIDRQQAQILTFITYIGCGISAIFLALTLLTYLLFEKLMRDIPAKILVQLCLSLLFLNLVFLLDGWLALYPAVGLCISTAFFLHYFLLTSFTWAGLEALHMYLSIVRVFTPYLSRYMLKFSLIGWGIPLLVVIVVISVDKDNYGVVTYGKYTDGTSDDFCWLRNDIAFYVGVVAYFLLIFALCLLVFIIVMVQLSRIKKQNPQNQPPNRGVMTDLRSIAGLIVLLGLTWGFALFAWGPLYLPFVYLFTIFNSLQGFLVFIFHCAVKENVRRQWRTYLCCGKLRLAENSDWSRTATQNRMNLSVATATTSAPHLTSRSSSVISDSTNSNESVFADSGISDSSNNDAILNEIHRLNISL